jgi:hypothetical protein
MERSMATPAPPRRLLESLLDNSTLAGRLLDGARKETRHFAADKVLLPTVRGVVDDALKSRIGRR